MEWLQDNWIWIALGGAFIAMHMFGHGGHGGHRGGHGGDSKRDPNSTDDATAAPGDGHAHSEGTVSTVAGLNDPVPAAAVGKRHKH